MSYDRVLPKPAALHYDSPVVVVPRKSSTLLEHKIMHDSPVSSAAASSFALVSPHASSSASSSSSSSSSEAEGASAERVSVSVPRKQSTSSDDTVKSRSTGVHFCLCQPDPKIPRPRNAFILYRQHHQAAVVAQNPGLANPEISKIIGEQWNSLPEDTKKDWKALAEEEKVRHALQYPEYKYQPKRTGRDGNPRSAGPGLGLHPPSSSTVCHRCGGRPMNPPPSPETPFTPTGRGGGGFSAAAGATITMRSHQRRERDPTRVPSPIRVMDLGSESGSGSSSSKQARARLWGEDGAVVRSPDTKRRRHNHTQNPIHISLRPNLVGSHRHRDKSPDTPYPHSPYGASRTQLAQARTLLQALHHHQQQQQQQQQSPYRTLKDHSAQDLSLKLPPLQTVTVSAGGVGPATGTPTSGSAFPKESAGAGVEATVMTIPFINKIKVLAKISPPLEPSFREASPTSQPRGAVIAVEGRDAAQVKVMTEYLAAAFAREPRYQVRTFEGPNVKPREGSPQAGHMNEATVDYLNTISVWHRISEEIMGFVRPAVDDDSVSPRSIIPGTANLNISDTTTTATTTNTAATNTSNKTAATTTTNTTAATTTTNATNATNATTATPIALVPRYQLTTADAFACSIPIMDSYAPLDHWQWMASLWRACVGPDITIYIRDCEPDEVDRHAKNPVEVRLQDARTVVMRRAPGKKDLEERVLKRVGFEVEDFLAQVYLP